MIYDNIILENKGENMMKKILLSFLVCALLLTGCKSKNIKEEDKDINTNSSIKYDNNDNNLLYNNQSLIYENGNTKVEVTIKNIGEDSIEINEVHMILKDSNGTEIVTLVGLVGTTLKKDEEQTVVCTYGDDLTGIVSSITYELVKQVLK